MKIRMIMPVVGLATLSMALGACGGLDSTTNAVVSQPNPASSDALPPDEGVQLLGVAADDMTQSVSRDLAAADIPGTVVVVSAHEAGAQLSALSAAYDEGSPVVVVGSDAADAGDVVVAALNLTGEFGSGGGLAAAVNNGEGGITFGSEEATARDQELLATWLSGATAAVNQASAANGEVTNISPSDEIRSTRIFTPGEGSGSGPYTMVDVYARYTYSCSNQEYQTFMSVDVDMDSMKDGTYVGIGAQNKALDWQSQVYPAAAQSGLTLRREAPATTEPNVTIKSGFEATLTGNVSIGMKGPSGSITPQARWYNERTETLHAVEIKNTSKGQYAQPYWEFRKKGDTGRISFRDNSWMWTYSAPLPTEWKTDALAPNVIAHVLRSADSGKPGYNHREFIPLNWAAVADSSRCPSS